MKNFLPFQFIFILLETSKKFINCCHSERSEESNILELLQDRFFTSFRMTLFQLFLLLLLSCTEDINVQLGIPGFNNSELLSETYPLPDFVKTKMNGIYRVVDGGSEFGDYVVLKWCEGRLSVFCGKNFAFMQLQGGQIDSLLLFEGYWRFANSPDIGLVRLTIKRDEGGRSLMRNESSPQSIILRGSFGNGNLVPGSLLTFVYDRPINTDNRDLLILAHRGGGRNSDRLPASENSLEMIQLAGQLGADGIEIDVRLTKDFVPIIFHDEFISSRTVVGDFLIGPIANYTFKQLSIFCTLKNGEKIPALREVLSTVVYKTHHKVVWLDIKVPNLMDKVIALQKEFLDSSKAAGRQLDIFIGLPDEQLKAEYLSHPSHNSAPSLCEISIDATLQCNSLVWAPRWTLGTLNADVATIHGYGKKAFVWTLDDPEFIKSFITSGNYDGILTNYPYLVAYVYYTKNK